MTPTRKERKAGQRDRLQEVQREVAGGSTKDLWSALGGEDYSLSYEAVRSYVKGSVEAPAHFLADLSHRFGYRLEWLIRGEEPHKIADWLEAVLGGQITNPYEQAVVDVFLEECPPLKLVSRPVRQMVLEAWSDHLYLCGRHAVSQEHWEDILSQSRRVAVAMSEFLHQPFSRFGWTQSVTQSALNEYFMLTSLALRGLAKGTGVRPKEEE